jgi:opacity protein-like surface antigen
MNRHIKISPTQPIRLAGRHARLSILTSGLATLALAVFGPAFGADLPSLKSPVDPPTPFSWSGIYIGFTAGGAWGSFAPLSSAAIANTQYAQLEVFPQGLASLNALGSSQSIRPAGYAAGAELGYRRQFGPVVLGLEGDLQSLSLWGQADGVAPYPSPPGKFFQSNQYAKASWLLTLRPQVGFAFDNFLIYGTGGLAVTSLQSDHLLADNNIKAVPPSGSPSLGSPSFAEGGKVNSTRLGYSVGGGAEYALSSNTSLKAEYLFTHFGRASASTIANSLTEAAFTPSVFLQSSALNANIVRLGLNYKLDVASASGTTVGDWWALGTPPSPQEGRGPTDWELEVGARAGLSSGNIGAPQPLLNQLDTLASRLQYQNEQGFSLETFGRLDHESGLFIKGLLGAGGVFQGHMNDEDYVWENPKTPGTYSNTLQGGNQGSLSYAVFDVGYAMLRVPGAKVGPFIGYSYFGQHVNTYGCLQLAANADWCPTPDAGYLGLAQDDRLHSLRVGVSAEAHLTDRLNVSADAAYVPYAEFRGHDDHNARQLMLPEAAGNVYGVMLEGVLSYELAQNWSIGVGGRYWAWNTGTGTVTFQELGKSPPFAVEPARYTTERFGGFLQVSHHWGDTTRAAKLAESDAGVPDWTGVYLGGQIGGGWSDASWPDSFPPTTGPDNPNVAGAAPNGYNAPRFGDMTHGTGPLAGGQVGYNVQRDRWVFGVQADASAADMRGENTCFSGVSGVNCQHTINALGSLTGRVGYAWDRALFYVKAGGAWANINYVINANTGLLTSGEPSTSATPWGWTLGGGLEYALDKHWSFNVEYAHKDFSPSVSFTTLDRFRLNESIHQTVDTLTLGVNYRFNLAGSSEIVAKY